MRMSNGIKIINDNQGIGLEIEVKKNYSVKIGMWMNQGTMIVSPEVPQLIYNSRSDLCAGIFYGMQGMRIGGRRKIRIPLHLIENKIRRSREIPENAILIAEIEVLEICELVPILVEQ